jgi:hypothetical protein
MEGMLGVIKNVFIKSRLRAKTDEGDKRKIMKASIGYRSFSEMNQTFLKISAGLANLKYRFWRYFVLVSYFPDRLEFYQPSVKAVFGQKSIVVSFFHYNSVVYDKYPVCPANG